MKKCLVVLFVYLIVVGCQHENVKPTQLKLVDYLNSKGYSAQSVSKQQVILSSASIEKRDNLFEDLRYFYSTKGYYLKVADVATKEVRTIERTENYDCYQLGLQFYPESDVVCAMYVCFQMGGPTIFDTTCVSLEQP